MLPVQWLTKAPIAIDTVGVAMVVVEAVLYGVSLFMCLATLYVLYRKRPLSFPVNRKLVVMAFLFISVSTIHLVLNIIRLEIMTIMSTMMASRLPDQTLYRLDTLCFYFRNFSYVLQHLLGDAVIIFRCYVLWRRYWVVIPSIILWCGVGACGFMGAGFGPWDRGSMMTAFFALTLGMNTIGTALIAYRIGTSSCKCNTTHLPLYGWRIDLRSVMHIVIDAGLIYSLAVLVVLCSKSSEGPLWDAWNPISPIISIMFYMVIIRVTILQSSCDVPHSSSDLASIPLA
ncbi:hypothetical protein BV22DRAFT_1039337 [Leucogyrophana mollusca]|uniref:Uncharacterized protein n=1 Tax=Leucogyrophana mollusca TaxID=85980 RepID=A0ACB8B6K3_9AGAM|nr:hypothetical protein BV22DRAFT_1039337 [Leucogyrophana mollusca]